MTNIDQNSERSKDKKVYYFGHDFNARSDEKIIKLRMKLGLEGYGIYWILIECLAEASQNMLKLSSVDALAYANVCDGIAMHSVIMDFSLFEIEKIGGEEYFFSKSLNARLAHVHERRKSAVAAAKKRWGNKQEKQIVDTNTDASAMLAQCDRIGSAMQSKVKESKVKESKLKEREGENPHPEKIQFGDFVFLTESQASELPEGLGKDVFDYYVKALDDYLAQGGKKKYTNHGRVIANWARRDQAEMRGPFKAKIYQNRNGPPQQQQTAAQRNQAHNANVLKNILEKEGYEIS